MALVGAQYNTTSKIVMSYFITESAAEDANVQAGKLPCGAPIPSGQSVAWVNRTALPASFTLANLITAIRLKQAVLALNPPQPMAVVDTLTNTVTDIAVGDFQTFVPPNAVTNIVVAAPSSCGIGWTYNPLTQTLTAPVAVGNAVT